MRQKIIAIVGPTASGKTKLSIELAKKFNGEIVSADSRQIYRGMDIGTAKPSYDIVSRKYYDLRCRNISHRISHYLISIKNPNERYTVAEYKKDALKAIHKILQRSKLPILVGGTGLYVDTIAENLEIPEVKPNKALRAKLDTRIKQYGLRKIYEELIKLDPEATQFIDPNNPRRVIRALEVALITKKPFSKQRRKGELLFDVLKIGIDIPQEKLKQRIDKRVQKMIKDGLIEEVKRLVKKYGVSQPAFDAIGYREIIDYLGKKTSLKEAVEKIKVNTSRYAKRQMTWFKRDKNIRWVKSQKEAEKIIMNFL